MDRDAPRRRSRNKTNMQKFLDETKDITRYIEFLDNGMPTGKFAANFSNYLGWYLRETVPCTLQNWKQADEELRNRLWDNVKARLCFLTIAPTFLTLIDNE